MILAVGHGRLPVGRPALLRARPRAELPRGRRLEHRLAGVLAARRRSSCSCSPTPTTRSPTRPSTSSSARCRSTTCSSSCCCSRTSGSRRQYRARLLFWGIAAALVLRGLAILGGVALIEQFHFVIYVLGVLLLILAYRILQGVDENVDPDKNFVVRLRAQVLPGHARRPRRPLVRDDRRQAPRHADLPLPGRDRRRRHRVRGRLDPGRVRDHARLGADLDGQRVRAARPARAVRARGGDDPALPLPRRDDRGRARAWWRSSC